MGLGLKISRSVDVSSRKSVSALRCPQRQDPPDKRPLKPFRPRDYSAAGIRFREDSRDLLKVRGGKRIELSPELRQLDVRLLFPLEGLVQHVDVQDGSNRV